MNTGPEENIFKLFAKWWANADPKLPEKHSWFRVLDFDTRAILQDHEGGVGPLVQGPLDLGDYGAIGVEVTDDARSGGHWIQRRQEEPRVAK